MKIFLFAISVSFFLSTAEVLAIDAQGMQDTMGAISKLLNEQTKISGVAEKQNAITPSADLKYQQLETDLQPCVTTKKNDPELVVIGQDGVTAKFKKFDLSISGSACPMLLEAHIASTTETQDHFEANFIMKMEFKEKRLIDTYQVKTVSISGVIKSQVSKNGSTVTIPTSLTMSAHGEDNMGKVTEQSIKMAVGVNVDMAKFAFGFSLEQSGYLIIDQKKDVFSGITKMEGFGNISNDYMINGQKVSASEFQKFMQAFIVTGNVQEQDPNAPDGKTLSQCDYAVFERSSVNTEQLKSQISSRQFQSTGQLARGQACRNDSNFSFNYKGKTYNNSINFTQDWIALNSDAKTGNNPLGLYILYKDTQAQALESDNFVFGMICQPTTTCH